MARLPSSDLHVVARIAPDVLILEIKTNDLVVTSSEVVGSEIENLVRLGALRFSSIISTLCFLSSQRFFVGYIEFFLTRRNIFLCPVASTLTKRFSTIYIVVAGVRFFGHNACFKNCLPHSLHLLNFHTFYALIFQCFATFSPVMGSYFLLLIHSSQMCHNFYFTSMGIRPLHYCLLLVHLFFLICMRNALNFMDLSIVFLCCGFIHSFRADSSALITRDSSPLF